MLLQIVARIQEHTRSLPVSQQRFTNILNEGASEQQSPGLWSLLIRGGPKPFVIVGCMEIVDSKGRGVRRKISPQPFPPFRPSV